MRQRNDDAGTAGGGARRDARWWSPAGAVLFVAVVWTPSITAAASITAAGRTAPSPAPRADTLALSSCDLGEYDGPARCGQLVVAEDPGAPEGRRISVHVAVLDARSDTVRPDPLFVFAGGPGQAATEYAGVIGHQMPDLLRHHDVVLVDRRGTGGSNPLGCDLRAPRDDPAAPPDDPAAYFQRVTGAQIRRCRRELEERADLTLYTTPFAVDDFDRVRAALGYRRINLYGASYGSREALVYLRRHPEHVRSVLLEAAMPLDRRPLLEAARYAQQSMERLLDDCLADLRCRRAFPTPRRDLERVLRRLDEGPVDYRPPAGDGRGDQVIELNRSHVTSTLRTLLVFPAGASRVPRGLHHAANGDYRELGDLALRFRRSSAASLKRGLFLSVVCAEELARTAGDEIGPATEGTFWGDSWIRSLRRQCDEWPTGRLPPGYFEPVRSRVPVLVLSGWLDPITPPAWAARLVERLPNGRRIVVREGQHNFRGGGCYSRVVARFVDHLDPESLDARCLADVKRPPFARPEGP